MLICTWQNITYVHPFAKLCALYNLLNSEMMILFFIRLQYSAMSETEPAKGLSYSCMHKLTIARL